MGVIKGQNLRLKVDEKYVAFSTKCTLHVSANLITYNNASKDDTTFAWEDSDVESMSYDLSAEQLFSTDADTNGSQSMDILKTMLAGKKIDWSLEKTSGEKNRETSTTMLSGKCIINDHSITANNKENGSASFQAKGTGAITSTPVV